MYQFLEYTCKYPFTHNYKKREDFAEFTFVFNTIILFDIFFPTMLFADSSGVGLSYLAFQIQDVSKCSHDNEDSNWSKCQG